VLIAQDGEGVMRTLRRERPDLVLLDLAPPACDGQNGTSAVRDGVKLTAMPIIRLSSGQDENHISGWDPAKSATPVNSHAMNSRAIADRVRSILHRAQGEPAPRGVIQAGNILIDLDGHRVKVGDQPVHLTPTELGLLQALAERPGHTLTRQEMVDRGLGYSYEGVARTVDSHVKNLRRKLAQAGAESSLVETVFGVGYRLTAGPQPD
jgi:two-component system alkaline phosphatase synthesis response regulator PhoP